MFEISFIRLITSGAASTTSRSSAQRTFELKTRLIVLLVIRRESEVCSEVSNSAGCLIEPGANYLINIPLVWLKTS